jgi:hypothetical protein
MARRRTPLEAWMGTPDEVDFCPHIYPVRHICFSMKKPEHLLWLEDKLSFPPAVFRPPLKLVRS